MDEIIEVEDYIEYKKEIDFIRMEVFVKEYKITVEDEWDGLDEKSFHVLILRNEKDEKIPIATGRVTPEQQIGRISVMKNFRKRGYGKKVMEVLEKMMKKKYSSKFGFLTAQVEAVDFYKQLGYKVVGKGYMDCGLLHYPMKKEFL